MIAPLSSAGVILSYKCNSKCRHCLYCCSNEWSGWMSVERVRRIYEGTLATAGDAAGFHLAGGEAFLNFPLLLEAVRLAAECGIRLDYVETNAGWFTDTESAVDKLAQLREAGLTCLLISASPFHAEHIPIEKTIGAVRASLQVFDRHGTMVWLPEFLSALTGIATEGTIRFEDYAAAVGESGAREAARYGGQLIPGGRSPFTLSQFLPQRPVQECFIGNCEYELMRSARGHFDPYGNIVPGVCSGISVGDSADLESAYRGFRLEDHPVLRMLCTGGVRELYEMAAAKHGFVARDAYAGKCALCVDIRRHLVLSGAEFDELKPKEFYERV